MGLHNIKNDTTAGLVNFAIYKTEFLSVQNLNAATCVNAFGLFVMSAYVEVYMRLDKRNIEVGHNLSTY
jgi:hypothetical protein